MTLTSWWQVFWVGTFGGTVLELLHWYALVREERLPDYMHKPLYWVVSGLMAIAAGGLAWLYFGAHADGVVAFHVGLSAPLIFQKLVSTAAHTPGARGAPRDDLISFFRW